MSKATPLSATAKRLAFRAILKGPGVTLMPGGFSPLYARMAEEVGFSSFFLAGSQLSAFLYGVPDTGIIGLRDVVDHARHVAMRTGIPILVDGDTGFGNAVNVHFTVGEIVQSGAAGIQIEDQEAPKKSGTSAGRRCIPIAEAIGKYRAAIAARNALDPSFVVCARCDANGAEGEGFDRAVERCVAYLTDGGADLVWLNACESAEQIRRACAVIPGPVLVAWGGKGPEPSLTEYANLGARIVIQPTIVSRVGIQAGWEFLHELKARGVAAVDDWRTRTSASLSGPANLRGLVDHGRIAELEREFLPPDVQRDYAGTWGSGGLNTARPSAGGPENKPE